jgi:hypothetical protein
MHGARDVGILERANVLRMCPGRVVCASACLNAYRRYIAIQRGTAPTHGESASWLKPGDASSSNGHLCLRLYCCRSLVSFEFRSLKPETCSAA